MITFDPKTTKKPYYPEAFNDVGKLPSTVKHGVRHLVLQIFRHTNNDPANPRFGKAWVALPELAREMGYSANGIGDLFKVAEKLGIVGREHYFQKRDGTKVVTHDYDDGIQRKLGEYVGSCYWV